jgi:hypothetical protein
MAFVAAVGLAAAMAMAAPASGSIKDEPLFRFGAGLGTGAGQLRITEAIAGDPVTGHIYVVGGVNNRVSEFTPWGQFVKAFGWDVAPGAVNEVQEIRVHAAAGTFKLSFAASTTSDLPYGSSGTQVETALNALASIGGAGASVSVDARAGSVDGSVPAVYVITFKGSLAGTDVAQITAANGATPLSGGVPSTSLEARTRAEGTAGGTGLESCTGESGCKAGSEGSGAGQMGAVFGLAVDSTGNVYVRDTTNGRIQKFCPAPKEPSTSPTKTKSAASTPPALPSPICPTPTGCWSAKR